MTIRADYIEWRHDLARERVVSRQYVDPDSPIGHLFYMATGPIEVTVRYRSGDTHTYRRVDETAEQAHLDAL